MSSAALILALLLSAPPTDDPGIPLPAAPVLRPWLGPAPTVLNPGTRRADPRRADPRRSSTPTAWGAFTLKRWQPGFAIEFGYPFVDFRFGLGVHSRVQIELGYRGLYGMSHGVYGGLKATLYRRVKSGRHLGLGLRVLGGYRGITGSDSWRTTSTQHIIGGLGGMGELSLLLTAGVGHVAFHLGVGTRLSEVREGCTGDLGDCWNPVDVNGGPEGFLFVPYVELGIEARLGRHISMIFTLGVDTFPHLVSFVPALVRARLGFMAEL